MLGGRQGDCKASLPPLTSQSYLEHAVGLNEQFGGFCCKEDLTYTVQSEPSVARITMKTIRLSLLLLVFLGAAFTLLGWVADKTTWVVLGDAEAPMQFNTALGFLLTSIGLITQGRTPQARAPRVVGMVIPPEIKGLDK